MGETDASLTVLQAHFRDQRPSSFPYGSPLHQLKYGLLHVRRFKETLISPWTDWWFCSWGKLILFIICFFIAWLCQNFGMDCYWFQHWLVSDVQVEQWIGGSFPFSLPIAAELFERLFLVVYPGLFLGVLMLLSSIEGALICRLEQMSWKSSFILWLGNFGRRGSEGL